MLDIASLVLRLATEAHMQRVLVEIISSWIEMKTEIVFCEPADLKCPSSNPFSFPAPSSGKPDPIPFVAEVSDA